MTRKFSSSRRPLRSILIATLCGTFSALLPADFAHATAFGQSGDFCVNHFDPSVSCTGNEVLVDYVQVTQLVDGCTGATDTATVRLAVGISTSSPTSYDIGVFAATDGGNARSGSACYHDFFAPPLTMAPTYVPSGFDSKVELRDGPWWDGDEDNCGDLEGMGPGSPARSVLSLPSPSSTFTISCSDMNSDGNADIDLCTSWSGGTSNGCNGIANAYPPSSTRCACQRVEVTGLAFPTGTTIGGGTTTTTVPETTTTTTLAPTGSAPVPVRVVVIKPGRLFKLIAPHEAGLPTGDPRSAGAVLSFTTSTGGQTYVLPSSCWTGDATNGYTCDGDPVCRTVRVRPDLLKAICRDDTGTFGVPNGGDVDLLLTVGGADGYCATCGGEPAGNPNRLYSRRDCAAPPSCP